MGQSGSRQWRVYCAQPRRLVVFQFARLSPLTLTLLTRSVSEGATKKDTLADAAGYMSFHVEGTVGYNSGYSAVLTHP